MKKKLAWIALGILFLSSLIFIQLPLSGSLPGKVDNWFYVAAYECIKGKIEANFSGLEFGSALYPESGYFKFGNFSPGMSLFYLPFRWIGIDIIWSFWLLMSFVYAFNVLGFISVARVLKVPTGISIVAGFLFAFNNYTLSNIDNPDGLCWGAGLISIALLIEYLRNYNWRYIISAGFFFGANLYFSSYMFFLTGVFWAMIILGDVIKKKTYTRKGFIGITTAAIIVAIMIFPFVSVYFLQSNLSHGYNAGADPASMKYSGLHLKDLFTYLPNTLYSIFFPVAQNDWYSKAHSAGIGILFPLLAFLGLKKYTMFPAKWGVFFVVFCLAIGPYLFLPNLAVPTPVYPFMEGLGLRALFRVNIRAYFGVIFFLVLGWAMFMSHIRMKQGKYSFGVILISVFVFIENIPLGFRTYDSRSYILHAEHIKEIKQIKRGDVVLHLPSTFYSSFYKPFRDQLKVIPNADNEVLHEDQYMFLQAVTGTNVINGFPGFIPQSRMDNQLLINDIENIESRSKLLSDNKVEYVMIHKPFLAASGNGYSIDFYKDVFQEFTLMSETNSVLVYKIR